MRKKYIIILVLFFFISPLLAQTKITGIVRDVNTLRELREVNIYIKGSQTGTTTDAAGRYTIAIPESLQSGFVVFQHISYLKKEIPIESLIKEPDIHLQPRVIELQGVQVIGQSAREKIEIARDIPQSVSILDAKNFEIRGYIDAGDLLKTEHSIQVEEEMSGKKSLSIRGGNADDVVVLYNGIKMNNPYNNVFDFSLIDLDNLSRLEVIKGSNTALYGPDAFSGVINIVPEIHHNYHIRAHINIGTYNYENIGLGLYHHFGELHASYNYKKGEMTRKFIDAIDENDFLKNNSDHHTLNIQYDLGRNDLRPHLFNLLFTQTNTDYLDNREMESLKNKNQVASLQYEGDVLTLSNVNIHLALQELDEDQTIGAKTDPIVRDIKSTSLQLRAEKTFKSASADWLVGYQLEDINLDFLDKRFDLLSLTARESGTMNRQHHGVVTIAKFKGSTGSTFYQNINFDVSLRHDFVKDEPKQAAETDHIQRQLLGNKWRTNMFKCSASLNGYKEDLSFQTYLSFGSNTKFPNLYQQISTPLNPDSSETGIVLEPEKITSYEISSTLSREVRLSYPVTGWEISANLFQSFFENKLRAFKTPGIPITLYDNVGSAKIVGIEAKGELFMFRKKLSCNAGIAKYFISDKSAFPFKSHLKRTLNVTFSHAGYSFLLHWFLESEQTGWIRNYDNRLLAVTLESYSNLDFHLKKSISLWKVKCFLNFSGRNILKKESDVLRGIAVRDRRFYISFGTQI